MSISVIINNRDLVTWPRAMVERIKRYDNIGDIIIVDNASTYEPLLEWYDTNPCKVIRCKNLGHAGAWISGAVSPFKNSLYIVTDSDLGIDDTPNDTLLYLEENMKRLSLQKLGLGLDWKKVKPSSPYYHRLNLYEKDRWQRSKVDEGIYTDVQIDTTFAIYNTPRYFIGGGSSAYPYIARHYPWELSIEDVYNNKEFKYYLDNASQSCSYKKVVTEFNS